MSYPDHFQFCHENTTQLYNMHRQKCLVQPLWACTRGDEEGYSPAIFYNEAQIQYNFDNGYWQEISQAESVEPEMKFPFTFAHKDREQPIFTATLSADKTYVNIDWDGRKEVSHYALKEAKSYIKDGYWIVKSVGEQPKEEAVSNLTITLNADTSDAVADMENATLVAINLAQAVENVTIALQSLQEQLAEMGLFGHVDDSCAAFCCGEH